jgi:hypothetical protein
MTLVGFDGFNDGRSAHVHPLCGDSLMLRTGTGWEGFAGFVFFGAPMLRDVTPEKS